MARPNLKDLVGFIAALFLRAETKAEEVKSELDAAILRLEILLAEAKAEIDAVSPGAGDVIFAKLQEKVNEAKARLVEAKAKVDETLSDIKGQASPDAFVRLALAEASAVLASGQSLVRQPPTNIAG